MFKKFFEKSFNAYIYKNGGDFASKVNVDKDKTKGFNLLRTARLLSDYEKCGGDLKFLVENDISLSLKNHRLGGSFYNDRKKHIAMELFQGDKETTLHHEITHAKQFNFMNKNGFDTEKEVCFNFKNYIVFHSMCEADAFSCEAQFAFKNKEELGICSNIVINQYNKFFNKDKDEYKAYEKTFDWAIEAKDSPLKNYNWFLTECYLLNEDKATFKMNDKDFISLLDGAMKMKIDKNLIDKVVKNFKISQNVWHKLSEQSANSKDFSFKEFPLRSFDNKEALEYMQYILKDRNDVENISSLVDLYKKNDVIPTKEGKLYNDLNNWIKKQPKNDKDALRLSNMVDTLESRIMPFYENNIEILKLKDVEFSKNIQKSISNKQDALMKSKKGYSL